MKIRTNFVTNSSSYSSAEIKIDNPVLLEILEKYKTLGAFKKRYARHVGISEREEREDEYIDNPCLDEEEVQEILEELDDKPLAFYLYEPEGTLISSTAPESLEDVAECILDIIRSSKVQMREECRKELKERADEITKNYIEVYWEVFNDGYGEAEPEEDEETSWEFYYER